MGLFDNPFVNEQMVDKILTDETHRSIGLASQKRSLTLLKNQDKTLPLSAGKLKVYAENLDSTVLASYATVVATPEEADFAIIRLNTPWQPADTQVLFALSFHHGDLDLKAEEKTQIMQHLHTVPK